MTCLYWLSFLFLCKSSQALSKYPIIHCFADPMHRFVERECDNCVDNRHVNEYISFWRLRLLGNRPMPKYKTICIDLEFDCNCKFLTVKSYCAILKGTVMTIGDSMMESQVLTFHKICGDKSMMRFRIFPRTNPPHFAPKQHLSRITPVVKEFNPDVVYINFAMHHLALYPFRMVNRDIFNDYERWIGKVIGAVYAARPNVRIVWLLSNSMCDGKWNHRYKAAVDLYDAGNITWLQKYGPWRDILASRFNRQGVFLLNTRARRFLNDSFPNISVIDGFSMTDMMCMFSEANDGRHFEALRPLKLSVFFKTVESMMTENKST